MNHKPLFTKKFSKIYSKLDKIVKKQIDKKIERLCEFPELGKPLRNVLKGKRRVHVNHFVLIYEINENKIIFLDFEHHDCAYI